MNKERLSNMIEEIDGDLIEEAVNFKAEKRSQHKLPYIAAACAAVIALGAAGIFALNSSQPKPTAETTDPVNGSSSSAYEAQSGSPAVTKAPEKSDEKAADSTAPAQDIIIITPERYKSELYGSESAVIWPWEYLTDAERYSEVSFEGITYQSAGSLTDRERIITDRPISCRASGYDLINDKTYSEELEAFEIKAVNLKKACAVRFGDEYCLYRQRDYDPPKTLGEFFDDYDLTNSLKLEYYHSCYNYSELEGRRLNDTDELISLIGKLSDAEFVEKQDWSLEGLNYLSFNVSCGTTGAENRAMYITENGYLWTNICDYQYVFDIGEKWADAIISCASENSEPADIQAVNVLTGGEITEIGNGFVRFTDSPLCNEPDDAMTFTIPLDDIRIRRFFEYPSAKKPGDVIAVTFSGKVDRSKDNELLNIYTIQEARLSGSGDAAGFEIEE